MALNVQTFKTRALTAVIFVVVMMVGLLWNEASFFVLFSIVHFGAWLEYQKLVEGFNPDYKKIIPFHRYGIIVAGWCLMLVFTNNRIWYNLSEIGFWAGLGLLILIPLVILFEAKGMLVKNMAYSIFGAIYISLALALLIGIRMLYGVESEGRGDFGKYIALTLIFSIWINDTMAYIVGSFIGKTPLSKISPKKTWEGTVGGAILSVVVMAFVGKALGLTYVDAACIAALAAVAGTFGDLFESKLKRMAGVKDSGSFMPGHGGFLDRFDSLLFAAIAVWFYMVLFLR
ncbi:MAG TPA: phosphatidate cytidylyltransferase [Flavisolibacter sp.]|jgi:phosphatidate cytidylyltransferase|nr:phosphatidate cytidylyltransferase [Flavisolibacter sp.]